MVSQLAIHSQLNCLVGSERAWLCSILPKRCGFDTWEVFSRGNQHICSEIGKLTTMTAGNGGDRYWRSETRRGMMVVMLSNGLAWTPHPPRHEFRCISKSFGQSTHLNHCHLHHNRFFSTMSVLLLCSSLAWISRPSSNYSCVPDLLRSTMKSSRSSRISLQEAALQEAEWKLSEHRNPCLCVGIGNLEER